MILTDRNLGNDHLRIFANLKGFSLGDEVKTIDYIFFIDREETRFNKETGLRDMPEYFSRWLKSKYKDYLYEG
ncbi:hypothetical protein [uncultured Anaerococcus sp.]|uniref:hypothetical protein n=1 Tax=uncultured Anaerococcus sp. TaxID=293428 RepID=UPI0025F22EAD|nr:hypothetical protein [uncultured Anaerococcus sp.]